MESERGWLIGPGDKALSVDKDGVATFQRTDLSDADLLEATPQDGDARGRCVVRSVAFPQFAIGADATAFSPVGVCGQYYGMTGTPGHYELWSFGIWQSGVVQAVIEYVEQGANYGRHWQAAGLTWVKQ
jgi:hypothetical protein